VPQLKNSDSQHFIISPQIEKQQKHENAQNGK